MRTIMVGLVAVLVASCATYEPHIPYASLFRDADKQADVSALTGRGTGVTEELVKRAGLNDLLRTPGIIDTPEQRNLGVSPQIADHNLPNTLNFQWSGRVIPHLPQQVSPLINPSNWWITAKVSFPSSPQVTAPLPTPPVARTAQNIAVSNYNLDHIKQLPVERLQGAATDAITQVYTDIVLPHVYRQYGNVWHQAEISIGLDILRKGGVPSGTLRISSTCLSVSRCVVSPNAISFLETNLSSSSLTWRPANAALANMERGLAIYDTASAIGTTLIGGVKQFVDTINYIGRSAQTMNPPVYFRNEPQHGRFVELNGSGLRGWGDYDIDGGRLQYEAFVIPTGSRLKPGTVTSMYNKQTLTGTQVVTKQFQQTVPANAIERFAVTRYPVGYYFDANAPFREITNIKVMQSSGTLPYLSQTLQSPIQYHSLSLGTLKPIEGLSSDITRILAPPIQWNRFSNITGPTMLLPDYSRILMPDLNWTTKVLQTPRIQVLPLNWDAL